MAGGDEHDDEPLPRLPWLAAAPARAQLVADERTSRVVAAVLGAAIGDAIGHPTEFFGSFEAIRARWPPDGVNDFVLYWTRGDQRFAPYTDDTQMAEIVLRTLLWSRRESADLDATMRMLADGFVRWSTHPQGGHRAPGNACLAGCEALARGEHWSRAGAATAGGCGSVMRAYPFGLVFADDLPRAQAWSVAHSQLTHGDPIALAACAAMAIGTAHCLHGDPPAAVLDAIRTAAHAYCETTAEMIDLAIADADLGVPPEVTLDRLRGWAAHEAIAAAAYVFARHPDDPRAAILEAANTPGDSDSIATLVGALVGARTGLAKLPIEWVDEVERTDVLLALAAAI